MGLLYNGSSLKESTTLGWATSDNTAIFIHYKMINLESITNENNKEHYVKWPYIPDHPYRILIIGGSESRKTNTLINLINEQDYVDKIYLYAKNLSKLKYDKLLIKKHEDAGINHLND